MSEYKINSANIAFRCDATVDDLIDAIEAKARKYIPAIYVLNKIDSFSIEELNLLAKSLMPFQYPQLTAGTWMTCYK